MAELITGFLKTENSVWLGLVYIALVPAVFEEVMFRGYIMRALEKSWGIWAAIFVSGLMFGLYHIQPSNILPLSFLGIVFAYVTYISGSLYPAMVMHFVNNGSQVIYGAMNPEFLETTEPAGPGLPWYWLLLSIMVFFSLVYLLNMLKKEHVDEFI
jgi:membrane protease YdiL (CAAX protease family)